MFSMDDDWEGVVFGWQTALSSVSLTFILVGKEGKCLVQVMFHIYQA